MAVDIMEVPQTTGVTRALELMESGEILYQKYIIEWSLLNYDPGPVFQRQTLELASAGLDESDGVIITLEGTRRTGTFHMDRGNVVSPEAAAQIWEDERRRVNKYGVWDIRVKDIDVTNGPAEREELLESVEQKKKRIRAEESERNQAESGLGSAVKELTSFLKGNVNTQEKELDPQVVFDYLQKNFNTSQVEDIFAQLTETDTEPPKAPAKPSKAKK